MESDKAGPCVGPSKTSEFFPEGNRKPLERFKLRNNGIQFSCLGYFCCCVEK